MIRAKNIAAGIDAQPCARWFAVIQAFPTTTLQFLYQTNQRKIISVNKKKMHICMYFSMVGPSVEPHHHCIISSSTIFLTTTIAALYLHWRSSPLWARLGWPSTTTRNGTKKIHLFQLERDWRSIGHWQMLVIHCFGCDGPVKQAKPAASFYVWLALFSSCFFPLFTSPSGSRHPKIRSCCLSLTLVTFKSVMQK